MKKNSFTLKLSAVLISIFFLVNSAFAQQKIKDGTVSGTELPNNNAILDLESNNKGLLLPRVALTSTTVATPLGAHIEGMAVYNTATTGDVIPGYYYNDGTKWVKLAIGTFTDDQQITVFSIDSATNVLTITLEDGGTQTVDLSILSKEPWQVQGTTDKATDNLENIYQMGKVAINKNTTDKQLEVAGDFKAHYNNATYHSGINTSFTDFGTPMNIMYVADSANLISATNSSVLALNSGIANLTTNNSAGGGSVAAFSGATGGSAGLVANNTAGNITSAIWGYSNATESFVNLYHQKSGAEASNITLEKLKGVTLAFSKPDGTTEGSYTFPRNNGSANQILVTDGVPGNAQLSWKDASALTNNAWKILGNDSTNAGTNGIGSAVDGNYLGTTNAQNLVLGTAGTKRMIIDQAGNAYGGTNGSYVTPATANGGNNRNFIWGRSDSLVDAGNLGNSNANAIFGANNKVISGGTFYGSTNIISGSLNIAATSSSAIFGSNNKDSALYSVVAGRNNTIGTAGSHSVIIGGGDLATDGNYLTGRSSAVFGGSNKDSAGYTLVSGQSNTIGLNGTNGVAMGQGNTVAHSNSFALGTGAITTAANQLSANFSGGYHLIGIGKGAATDSIVTDSLGYIRHRSITSLANNAWSILGNAGTSSGSNSVGSAVDGNYLGTMNAQNLAIATNGVKRMIIDTLGNAVGGIESQINVDNSLGYTNGNFIWGSKDTINNDGGSVNGYNNVVFGFMNKSTAANSSIFGINNKDLNYTLDEGYNFMAGNDNTILDAVGTGASSNTVLGSGNTINTSRGSAVLGNTNTINNTHFNSIVVGVNNTMSADTAYAFGSNNTVTHGRSLAIGSGASTTARNQFSANFSGGYRLLGIGNADTTDYVVTDSAGYIRHRNIADFATSNIYTADGTLTGNRRLTMAQHTLQFYNAGATGGTTTFTDTLGADLTLAATSATGRSSIQLTAGPSGMYMFVDGNNAAQLTTSATSLNIGAFSKAPITFFTNDTERVNIDTAGRVGIGTSYPSSTLQVNGSVSTAIRVVSGSTTLTEADYTIIKTGADSITITLPAASKCAGRIYRIVEYAGDGNSSTITMSPAIQTYDSSSGVHLETYFFALHGNLTNGTGSTTGDIKSVTLQSNGTYWYSIGR